ncbi:hypothetical protein [Pelagibius sp. Alg239-R121]|uniref:hypothetical protein n=1 Tax=Pelagibius sp. Alg239-R121 TaxID=2993448 RepID=UPI0024A60F9E|nr:hypothetical protein [Pelagibius sp. Alg239-R121]
MPNSLRSQAEQHFSATQKKAAQAGKDKDKARKLEAAHVAKLKALRLAKEAADKELAEKDATAKATPKKPATAKKTANRKPKAY